MIFLVELRPERCVGIDPNKIMKMKQLDIRR